MASNSLSQTKHRMTPSLPSDEHGVEHDAEPPHVGRPARVHRVAPQDLGADVGRAPVLVWQKVVFHIFQHHSVFQRLQFYFSSEKRKTKIKNISYCDTLDYY